MKRFMTRLMVMAWALGASWPFAVQAVEKAANPVAAAKKHGVRVFKTVLHVSDDDPHKWSATLNIVRNIQNELGKDRVKIEIVVYGGGLGMLRIDSPELNRVQDALADGVRIVACENSMRGQNLDREDMMPGIGYVPAGVVELIKKQHQGYAYVRI